MGSQLISNVVRSLFLAMVLTATIHRLLNVNES